MAIVPGVATPTEMERALGLGLTHLKFFPAETLGGTSALKAFAAPYGAPPLLGLTLTRPPLGRPGLP